MYPIIQNDYIDEFYVQIPPFDDGIKPYYIISNYGKVINIYTGTEIIPHENENGYLQVSLMTNKGNGRVFRKVHRLVMMCFFYFEGCEYFQVNHKNGNKKINAYWNLEWSTPKENIYHAIDTGLRKSFKGEENPMSVISESAARNIGLDIIAGIPDHDIANKYCNGNISIVRGIAYGNTWQHLFSETEKLAIANTRRGNIITIDDRHSLCAYYQNNKDNYSGGRIASKIIKDAMISIGLDPGDVQKYRVAKRLYYKYESPEITSKYNY